MEALTLLVGDAQTFLTKVWASTPLRHTTDPERLVGLLGFEDVDTLLTSSAIRTPAVRVAQDGSVLPASSYTRSGASIAGQPLSGLVDARKVLDLFEGGATVVLQGLHRYWPPLTRLVDALELELGHPCQANAYLTPPGSQGFAVHSDSHDVFVFQTHGTKLWEVHDPERPAGRPTGAEEVLLEPGLVMYLPAGTPHAARAQDTVSLHVTIGINQLTWRDLLSSAVRRALDDVDQVEQHLPAGYLQDPAALTAGLADRLAQVAKAVSDLDPQVQVDQQVRQFLGSRRPVLTGSLVERMALEELTVQTRLRRRAGRPCVVQRVAQSEGDRLRLLLGDRELTVPARLAEAIEQVRTLDDFTPGDLPLDPQASLVLCRRLIREGLLEVPR